MQIRTLSYEEAGSIIKIRQLYEDERVQARKTCNSRLNCIGDPKCISGWPFTSSTNYLHQLHNPRKIRFSSPDSSPDLSVSSLPDECDGRVLVPEAVNEQKQVISIQKVVLAN